MFYRNWPGAFSFLLLLFHGCAGAPQPVKLKYPAVGKSPQILAVYEAWFGEPNHIAVGYSSNNPKKIAKQIKAARRDGIDAFIVDWYGDRDPYINQNYGQMQQIAAKHHFHIAMMYDQAARQVGATDEVISDLQQFHDAYLAANAAGSNAYLTYDGRPVIFIFPHGHFADWDEVRAAVNKWNPAPFLIDENLPGQYAKDFDGFYPWINPGPKGWAADGHNWGKEYLADFYKTMASHYSDKVIVGGAWPQFNDSKASWGLNRHIAPRCGQTFLDTLNFWKLYFPPKQIIPFVLIETWNDYEEGSEIEPGIAVCGGQQPITSIKKALRQSSPGR
jgi:hypothetical protein